MDGQGPVAYHHTRKEAPLPDKGTIKAPEVAELLEEQAHSLICESLAGGRILSKIDIQWKCKNKSQCKDMLQITLEICIPHKEHLRMLDMPPHLRQTTWHDLNRALQRYLKEKSDHQDKPTMVPNRMKWHQQIYQRLPGEEQAYSLRWLGCQKNMLEWLAEGRMEDTSEALKHQKPLIQESRHDAKSHTGITEKEKSHKWTQDYVSIAEGLINIIMEESVLACLNSGKPFGQGKDTLAYDIGMTLFQGRKNRQKGSMNCFPAGLRRTRQGHNDQEEENPMKAARLYFQVHSLKGSLHEMIIWVNYTDLQSHCHPWRTDTRVTWHVTILENHHDRAGCPLEAKSCNAPIKQLDYDQRKENNTMLDKPNYGEREHSEERKDQHNIESMEIPHTQSQQCLRNATATLTAGSLCRTDSLLESKQPHGNTQEGETGAVKIWFALKERNQCQPMVYGWYDKSIIGNKAAPLIVHLFLHIFTLYERMTNHHSSDLLTPQPDNLQWKTNPGKVPTALLQMHTIVSSKVFWRSRRQVLDGKIYGKKAYNSLVFTPTGPIPPTCTLHKLTTTISPITTMMCSYTYEEQALRILQSHVRWNAHIMREIDMIHNTFPEDLSELYELYGLLIWPYTIEEIVRHLRTPLIIFPDALEAIPTIAEW
jgi:hypothetical protein